MTATTPPPDPDRVVSPDGLLRIEFQSFEMRMSHWVSNPRVVHVPTGTVLLDRWGTQTDGQHHRFDEHGCLHMHLRDYPGTQPGDDIVIDPHTRTVYPSEAEFLSARAAPAAPPPKTPPPAPLPAAPIPEPPPPPAPAPTHAATTPAPSPRSPTSISTRQVIPWLVLVLPLALGGGIYWLGGMTAVMAAAFVGLLAFLWFFRNYKGN